MSSIINALFVESEGVYFDQKNIIPWDIKKDAFSCTNGAPAICHPPCKRWGRYWSGGPSAKVKRKLGDDGNCFAHSLWYVRTFGGIIEHPEASHAFEFYGLTKPPKSGGWVKADNFGGLCCCVEQGHYGHKARKATWLYINKVQARELIWGASNSKILVDEGFHSKEQADKARAHPNFKPAKRLSAKERMYTPLEFRDMLVFMITKSRKE